jgi:hypothetical protein
MQNIFLAGGFSENEYFYERVTTFASSFGDISVQRAADWFVYPPVFCLSQFSNVKSWVGVAKGAVLRGIGEGMIAAPIITPCPRHYGLCSISSAFEDWRHDWEDAVADNFEGEMVTNGQVQWLIKQRDAIFPDKSFHETMTIVCKISKRQLDRPEGTTVSNFHISILLAFGQIHFFIIDEFSGVFQTNGTVLENWFRSKNPMEDITVLTHWIDAGYFRS